MPWRVGRDAGGKLSIVATGRFWLSSPTWAALDMRR
jgi:hypothetical protein